MFLPVSCVVRGAEVRAELSQLISAFVDCFQGENHPAFLKVLLRLLKVFRFTEIEGETIELDCFSERKN